MLPSTPLPIRPKFREWLAAACATSLVTLLLWLGIANLRGPHYSPDFATALRELDAGNGPEAIDLFKNALRSNPSDPDLYQTICSEAALKKQWAALAFGARLGLQNCPQAPLETRVEFDADLTNGLLETRQPGWKVEALKAAQEAYNHASDDPAAMNLYAYTLAEIDADAPSLAKAQDILTNALEALRKMPDTDRVRELKALTQDSYGWTRCKQGAYPEAIEACGDAIEGLVAMGADGEALKAVYYHLGAAQRHNNDLKGARASLLCALSLDPNYREAREELDRLPVSKL